MASLEKLKAEWKRLATESERQQGAVERLKKEAEGKEKPKAEEIGALEEERKGKLAKVLAAKEEAKKNGSSLSSAKSEIAVLQNSKKTAEERAKRKKLLEDKVSALCRGKSAAEIEAETASIKSAIDALSERQAGARAEIAELRKAVEALSGAGKKCPVCDSELDDGGAEKIAGAKKSRMAEMQKCAEDCSNEIAAKKEALRSLEKSMAEIAVCRAEAERIESEGIDIPAIDAKLRGASARKEELEKLGGKLEENLAGLEALAESARKKSDDAQRAAKIFEELESGVLRLAGIMEKIAALGFEEKKYELERREAEALRVQSAKTNAEAESERQQAKLMGDMLELEKKGLSELEKKAELAKKYAAAAESMLIYKNALVSAQSELRAMLVEEINHALAEVWPAVYPYSDYLGVKIEADEKDYRLMMEKEGWKEVDSIASGGERACLCLALRIAFATVLTPEIGWLILDEPTHNLDSNAVMLLSEAISEKIPSIVEQTFVITHDSALGESGEGNVFRLERDKGTNGPTRVMGI